MTRSEVLRKYVIDELSKYGDRSLAVALVDSATPDRVRELCEVLSKGRENSVYRRIIEHEAWSVSKVPTSRVRIGGINKSVDPLLEKLGRRLDQIATSDEVRVHREFADEKPIAGDAARVLGRVEGGMYRIFDGNHRAVKLAQRGSATIEIVHPK